MPHVFVSHSSVDADAARAVVQILRRAGLAVWLDLEEISAGSAWLPALETALRDSSHFIVLVGETGVRRWVEREVRYALERNTADPRYRIIPILLPGSDAQDLPLFLRQQQALQLDWGHPDPKAVEDIASAILEAAPTRVSVLPPGESPFRGLLAFDTADALLFFGRDREVDELLGRLANTRFLAVVGESGSGKSSLIRAGLIPALLRGRMGNVDWRTAIMKPGESPLDALAEAVPQWDPKLSAGDRAVLIDRAKQLLKKSPDGLSTILAALQLPANSRQLLVVDQFEQLFTLVNSVPAGLAEATARFIDSILHASLRANSTLHVVLTLRVDFFGLCHRHAELWEVVTKHQYSVSRMLPEYLRDAIEKPLALAGLRPAPGLVDTMLSDVGSQPGGLALVEHALDRLWTVSGGRAPTFDDYRQIGGLRGAIQNHADSVMQHKFSTDAQRQMARRIFVSLTVLGEGTQDSARRLSKAELLSLQGEDAAYVLQVLADERLVTAGDAENADSLGIAHEALIREWKDLRVWIDTHRADIRFQREMEESWRKWKGDEDQLLRGARLEDAVQWVRKNPGELRPEVRQFVEASRIRAQRQSLLKRGAIAGLVVLFAISVFEWRRVETLREQSLIRQLLVESSSLIQTAAARETAVLLQVEAMKREPNVEVSAALRQSESALAQPISHLNHNGSVMSVAFSPTGKWVATGSWDKTARLMEVSTGRELWKAAHDGPVNVVAFAPDGKWVATGSADHSARLLDAATGHEVARFPHEGSVISVVFSPDSKWLATASRDQARLFDIAGCNERWHFAHGGQVRSLAFSPDSKWIATGSEDGMARVINVANGAEVAHVKDNDAVFAVAFSRNGRVAAGSKDGTARVVDAATGKQMTQLVQEGPVRTVAFSHNGRWVATGSDDGTARIFDAETGAVRTRVVHQGIVYKVAISPDDQWMATASSDQTAHVFSTITGEQSLIVPHHGDVYSVAFSPDGTMLATGSGDKSARVTRARSDLGSIRLVAGGQVYAVDISPDGKLAATGSEDNIARVMDAVTGKPICQFVHDGPVIALDFSPDGKLLATGSEDKTARIMDMEARKEILKLAHKSWVDAVAFSGDGRYLLTGSRDRTARLFETATGRRIAEFPHDKAVTAVALGPDGKWIVTASEDGSIIETATGKELWRTKIQGSVQTVAVSPDGKWLATGGKDATTRLINASTGKEVWKRSQQGNVLAVIFSPNGKWIATGGEDRIARVIETATGKEVVRQPMSVHASPVRFVGDTAVIFAVAVSLKVIELVRVPLDPGELIENACSRLDRNLTREEWERYIPGERCRATCPNLPSLCAPGKN